MLILLLIVDIPYQAASTLVREMFEDYNLGTEDATHTDTVQGTEPSGSLRVHPECMIGVSPYPQYGFDYDIYGDPEVDHHWEMVHRISRIGVHEKDQDQDQIMDTNIVELNDPEELNYSEGMPNTACENFTALMMTDTVYKVTEAIEATADLSMATMMHSIQCHDNQNNMTACALNETMQLQELAEKKKHLFPGTSIRLQRFPLILMNGLRKIQIQAKYTEIVNSNDVIMKDSLMMYNFMLVGTT